MKKKIVKGLLLATAIASVSFISPQQSQKAIAAGAQLREKSAFSYAQLDELREELKTAEVKKDNVNIRLKDFQVSIPLSYPKKGVKSDGEHLDTEVDSGKHWIYRKYYKVKGSSSSNTANPQWEGINIAENMNGEIVSKDAMETGKSKTPYRYYITYQVITSRKKECKYTATDYTVFSTKPIKDCKVDSKGYPKDTTKFKATEHEKDGTRGNYFNLNGALSQIEGIKMRNAGGATRLWENTGLKIGSCHYHVTIKVIDAKKFWKTTCESSAMQAKSYNSILYMNQVKGVYDTTDGEEDPVTIVDNLYTLAKYYNARKRHVNTSGDTCKTLYTEYNWYVKLYGPTKYDLTFEKYLCKSGNGLNDTYSSSKPGNMFSKYTYADSIKPQSVFNVKNITKTKIPRYDEEGTKNQTSAHDNRKKSYCKDFVEDNLYLKGIQVYQEFYDKNGKAKSKKVQEFWIKDEVLNSEKTQVTGNTDDNIKSKNYSLKGGDRNNTFYASDQNGIYYRYDGVTFSPSGEHKFAKDSTFSVNKNPISTKQNYALEDTVDGKYVEGNDQKAKTYSEIANYMESLYYKHVSGNMTIKLIYAPVTNAGKQLRINKVYYSVGEDGKTYVKSESSDSITISEEHTNSEDGKDTKKAYNTMINSIKAGDNPVKESGTVCGTLSVDGLTRVLAALEDLKGDYKEKYPESGATKAEKDKIKTANQKSLAAAKTQAIEYIRASTPDGSDVQYSLCGYSMKYRVSGTDTGNPKSVGINKNGKLVINMVSNEVWDGNDNTKKDIGKKAAKAMLSTDKFKLQDCNFGCTTSDDSPTITLYYFAPTTPMTQIVVMKNICKICEGANNSGTCKHCGLPRYEVYGGDKEIGTITDASDKHAGGIPMKVEEGEVVSGVATNFGHETSSDTATRKSRVVMPEGTTNSEEFPKVTASQISKYAKSVHGHGKESLAEHNYVPRDETYTENIHINTFNSLTGGGELGNNKSYDYVVEYYKKWVSTGEGTGYWTDDLSRPKIVHATWTKRVL